VDVERLGANLRPARPHRNLMIDNTAGKIGTEIQPAILEAAGR
jgi:hypothetical protein